MTCTSRIMGGWKCRWVERGTVRGRGRGGVFAAAVATAMGRVRCLGRW